MAPASGGEASPQEMVWWWKPRAHTPGAGPAADVAGLDRDVRVHLVDLLVLVHAAVRDEDPVLHPAPD